jgi:hypothetical protein
LTALLGGAGFYILYLVGSGPREIDDGLCDGDGDGDVNGEVTLKTAVCENKL